MPAKMKDGTPIKLRFEDKGPHVPGFREDGTRYEALTSWFRAETLTLEPIAEIYSQVPTKDALASGNESAFRFQNDGLCLESIGVDPSSMDMDHVETYDSSRDKPLPLSGGAGG